MRNRQIKRYCAACHQMVFSLGHEHRQEEDPGFAVRLAVNTAERELLVAGFIRRSIAASWLLVANHVPTFVAPLSHGETIIDDPLAK